MPRPAPSFVDPFVDPSADPLVDPVAAPTHPPEPTRPPVRRPRPAPVPRPSSDDDLPPLCNGDRLTQPEFHRRYLRTPETFHAELIEGMVFVMASPISLSKHGGPQGFLITWLGLYAGHTPGLEVTGPVTLVVATAHERGLHWFVLTDGAYVELEPDEDGVYRSPLWPGLWLPADAVWARDAAAALAAVRAGVATEGHAALVARLGQGA
ncbi:MAG: hypothetical protein IT332_12920 [Ardenticatenales bacterium]|nr:hypothetical protein [Ardenticatenales bacterium]